jgi:hypothetical protein
MCQMKYIKMEKLTDHFKIEMSKCELFALIHSNHFYLKFVFLMLLLEV